MINYSEAIDEIFGLFNYAWNIQSAAIVGYIPEVRWQGKEEGRIDGSKFFARVSQQTVFEEQTSLANADGKRRYTASGLIFIQLFCPKSEASSFDTGRKLAQIVKKIYRGNSTSNCIWFKNARINELDTEELFYRLNVVAEYEYDEIG